MLAEAAFCHQLLQLPLQPATYSEQFQLLERVLHRVEVPLDALVLLQQRAFEKPSLGLQLFFQVKQNQPRCA